MIALTDHVDSNLGQDKKNSKKIYASSNQSIQKDTLISKKLTFNHTIPVLSWLDNLEKDFDKTFVDLDLLLTDFDSDQVIYFL